MDIAICCALKAPHTVKCCAGAVRTPAKETYPLRKPLAQSHKNFAGVFRALLLRISNGYALEGTDYRTKAKEAKFHFTVPSAATQTEQCVQRPWSVPGQRKLFHASTQLYYLEVYM